MFPNKLIKGGYRNSFFYKNSALFYFSWRKTSSANIRIQKPLLSSFLEQAFTLRSKVFYSPRAAQFAEKIQEEAQSLHSKPQNVVDSHLGESLSVSHNDPRKTHIVIEDSAVKKFAQLKKQKNKPDLILRLSVDGGGCNGFQYVLNLEDRSTITSEDEIVVKDAITVVVDKDSLPYMEGAHLEYTDSLIKSGFQIKENPNADHSCSCGTSFAPKLL
mmetsp:Transcript_13418/g.14003  ORF Transcript_13418/g.14003 Transcript_13418/m.14003 type:complete len:216 (+) Transcript_13418:4-651(+)